MKDLLGPSAGTEDPWKLRARFGELSGEKYDAVTDVTSDYGILRTKLLAEIGEFPQRPDDRDRMAFLAKEERTDLEKFSRRRRWKPTNSARATPQTCCGAN